MHIYQPVKSRSTYFHNRRLSLPSLTKMLLRLATVSVLALLFMMMMQQQSVIAGTGNNMGQSNYRNKKPIGAISNPHHSSFFGDPTETNKNKRTQDNDGDDSDEDEYNDEPNSPPPPTMVDIYTEHEFIEYCHYYFKQYSGKNDGRERNSKNNNDRNGKFISQDDYASFFDGLCNTFHDEDVPTFHCPNPTFNELDTTIQLLFVTDICSSMDSDNHNEDEQPNNSLVLCLNALVLSNAAFGYHHHSDNTDKGDVVSMMFDDICCKLLDFMTLVGLDPDDTGCSVAQSPQPSPFDYYTTMTPSPSPAISLTSRDRDDKSSSTDEDPSNNSNIVVVPSTGSSVGGTTSGSSGGDGNGSSSNNNNNIPPTTVVDDDFDSNGRYKNKLRAATIIAGITLGAGGLCLIGIGSSRRFFFSLPSIPIRMIMSSRQQNHLANMYSPYSSSSSAMSSSLREQQQQQHFPNHCPPPSSSSSLPREDFDDDSISDMNDSIL